MTMTQDPRSPAEIERSIELRREALKDKLHALEHRLSPTERLREARERLDAETIAPWAALGAVATGAWLAARGLRRHYGANGNGATIVEETVCVDVAPDDVVL